MDDQYNATTENEKLWRNGKDSCFWNKQLMKRKHYMYWWLHGRGQVAKVYVIILLKIKMTSWIIHDHDHIQICKLSWSCTMIYMYMLISELRTWIHFIIVMLVSISVLVNVFKKMILWMKFLYGAGYGVVRFNRGKLPMQCSLFL